MTRSLVSLAVVLSFVLAAACGAPDSQSCLAAEQHVSHCTGQSVRLEACDAGAAEKLLAMSCDALETRGSKADGVTTQYWVKIGGHWFGPFTADVLPPLS